MDQNRITSIEVKYESWSECGIDEISAETLEIFRSGLIRHRQFNPTSRQPVNEYNYKISTKEMNDFFGLLYSEIKILEWDNDYSVPVCDGWAWQFIIRYSNRRTKKISGTVLSPPRGEQLKNYIYELTNFSVKPWVF